MRVESTFWSTLARGMSALAAIWFIASLDASCAQAQAIAEAGVMTSNSAGVGTGITQTPKKSSPTPAKSNSSPHLVASSEPPAEEVNRRDFEDNAGEKAGKLLLRSEPTGADIYINDRLVGKTPLLILVAPGKYKIDMVGARQESGHTTVGVLPKSTETAMLNLSQRYPTTVKMH